MSKTNSGKQALCPRGVRAAKQRYEVWPSAYASGHAAQVCSGRITDLQGERKVSPGFGPHKDTRSSSPLARWYAEEWIDVCTGEPCGRRRRSRSPSKGKRKSSRERKYPYCRPTKKVSDKTPKLASALSASEKKRLCAQKRRLEAKKTTKTTPKKSPPQRTLTAAHANTKEKRSA